MSQTSATYGSNFKSGCFPVGGHEMVNHEITPKLNFSPDKQSMDPSDVHDSTHPSCLNITPFIEEIFNEKVKLVMGWFLDKEMSKDIDDQIMSGYKITAKSIEVLLNKMPHRGYLRLMNLDENIVNSCFEIVTLQCIEKYIKNAAEEEWICPGCRWFITKKKISGVVIVACLGTIQDVLPRK